MKLDIDHTSRRNESFAPRRAAHRAHRWAMPAVLMAATVVLAAMSGCDDTSDDQTRTLIPLPATATAASTPDAASAVGRRSLRIIPFTAEFSRDWQISSGSTGTTVVEARTAGGQFEVFILTKDPTTTELMNLMLADAAANSASPNGAATRPATAATPTTAAQSAHVAETQRLLKIEGAQGVEYTQTDSQGLITVRTRLFVPSDAAKPDAPVQVYEVNFAALTKDQLRADGALIRSIIDSLKYDESALRTGN